MENCIWKIEKDEYPRIEKDEVCDVLIVGGGITGISLLYYLKDSNQKVILIERKKIGETTTMKSTAKLTYLQQDVALKIKKSQGYDAAKAYVESQIDAINEVLRIVKEENISCQMEKNISYLYVRKRKNEKKLRDVYDLYKKMGFNPVYRKTKEFPSSLAFYVEDTYVFHPLLYIKGLLDAFKNYKNISIYEDTGMVRYRKKDGKYLVFLKNGKTVTCSKLVFTNHYLPFVTPFHLPTKNYLETSIVVAEPHENHYFNAINLDKEVESIRFYDGYRIVVKSSKLLSNSSILNEKEKEYQNFDYVWHNYDLYTQTYLPMIGKIKSNEEIYIATGYNTWGMTNSNVAARILASYLKNEKNPLMNVFKSHYPPSIFSTLQFIKDNTLQVIHWVGSHLPRKTKAKIIWKNGKRYGVYKDSKGVRHAVSLVCPHMKCGLRFNDFTKRWECPCHGSEFDIDGNLLRGPSTDCVSREL